MMSEEERRAWNSMAAELTRIDKLLYAPRKETERRMRAITLQIVIVVMLAMLFFVVGAV